MPEHVLPHTRRGLGESNVKRLPDLTENPLDASACVLESFLDLGAGGRKIAKLKCKRAGNATRLAEFEGTAQMPYLHERAKDGIGPWQSAGERPQHVDATD